MHMSDALLSPAVAGAMCAASGAAVAASVAIVIGSVFAMAPSDEANYARSASEEEIVNLAEIDGHEILRKSE